jgi:hypothetical protein
MSQENYIIICSGRGEVLVNEGDPQRQVLAAMQCAERLVTHVALVYPQLPGGLEADVEVVSHLQHAMMEVLPTIKKPEAEKMVADMFVLLDAIEAKVQHAEGY